MVTKLGRFDAPCPRTRLTSKTPAIEISVLWPARTKNGMNTLPFYFAASDFPLFLSGFLEIPLAQGTP
ncbi:hypothetical protein MESS4_p40104 [Mesorhizobium sp. STM 4661]|nr:hypothetical protein MESS4_p40104 [Mesorhizobium sp. STM 4661]